MEWGVAKICLPVLAIRVTWHFERKQMINYYHFLADGPNIDILMADTIIWGTKDFQVPEFFNFADVIDEWAQKEKVNDVFFITRFN